MLPGCLDTLGPAQQVFVLPQRRIARHHLAVAQDHGQWSAQLVTDGGQKGAFGAGWPARSFPGALRPRLILVCAR